MQLLKSLLRLLSRFGLGCQRCLDLVKVDFGRGAPDTSRPSPCFLRLWGFAAGLAGRRSCTQHSRSEEAGKIAAHKLAGHAASSHKNAAAALPDGRRPLVWSAPRASPWSSHGPENRVCSPPVTDRVNETRQKSRHRQRTMGAWGSNRGCHLLWGPRLRETI